ncbi:MAG: PAS domain-containing protein [Pseudodesulfovibrio sp.]
MPATQKTHTTVTAFKSALIYAIFGGLWILLSDKLLGLLAPDMETYATLQTWKGWFYIALTALLVFHLTRRELRALATAHEALVISENRYRMATRAARVGTWEWDIPSGDLILNEEYVRPLGYEPGHFPPTLANWEALIHPDDKPRVLAAVQAHLRGQTGEYAARYRMLTRDGHWKRVLDQGQVFLRGADGAPLKAVGVQIVLAPSDEESPNQ